MNKKHNTWVSLGLLGSYGNHVSYLGILSSIRKKEKKRENDRKKEGKSLLKVGPNNKKLLKSSLGRSKNKY